MKLRDTRLWVLVIALAFLVLWVVSVGVAYAAPVQEPLPGPIEPTPSPGSQAIGISGWCLVGLGFLGVVAAVVLSSRPKRRRTPRSSFASRSHRAFRSSRSPASSRFRGNVERRYH